MKDNRVPREFVVESSHIMMERGDRRPKRSREGAASADDPPLISSASSRREEGDDSRKRLLVDRVKKEWLTAVKSPLGTHSSTPDLTSYSNLSRSPRGPRERESYPPSLAPSFYPDPTRPIVLLSTSLSEGSKVLLEKFTAAFSARVTVTDRFSSEATHLVVTADKGRVVRHRTMKYMSALAGGLHSLPYICL